MQETLIAAHIQGQTYYFEASLQAAASVYGGPLPRRLTGATHGPAPLHHIATLSAQDLPMLGALSLPLLYGFQYSGCEMDYAYDTEHVQLLHISPAQSDADWPYENYPARLAQLALKLAKVVTESWDDFSSRSRYPNLPAQQGAELVAVIPAPRHIGQSLWGEEGDDEGVCVVCECDLSAQRVRSYNICS